MSVVVAVEHMYIISFGQFSAPGKVAFVVDLWPSQRLRNTGLHIVAGILRLLSEKLANFLYTKPGKQTTVMLTPKRKQKTPELFNAWFAETSLSRKQCPNHNVLVCVHVEGTRRRIGPHPTGLVYV